MSYANRSSLDSSGPAAPYWNYQRYAGARSTVYQAALVAAAVVVATIISLSSPAVAAVPGHAGGRAMARALSATASRCSLSVVYAVSGESAAADERQTASWTLLRANGWTVYAPSSSWHLSASDAGADVLSPDGRSDASLAAWYQLGRPWSLSGLAAEILGQVSAIHTICRSPVEHGATSTTQATELTGKYQGEAIHAIIILSVMTPNDTETSVGETRSLYTSAAGWSAASERTLMLIITRAILVPHSL